jgi:hypothetical protein
MSFFNFWLLNYPFGIFKLFMQYMKATRESLFVLSLSHSLSCEPYISKYSCMKNTLFVSVLCLVSLDCPLLFPPCVFIMNTKWKQWILFNGHNWLSSITGYTCKDRRVLHRHRTETNKTQQKTLRNEEHGHHQSKRGEFRCPSFLVVVNSALTLLLGYDAFGFR